MGDITDTHMLTDMAVTMVDTTDTPTDTVTLERDLLMLNLKLKPNPKLKTPPGTDTTVDTTVIPTDTDMLVPTDTMAATGGKLFTMNSHFYLNLPIFILPLSFLDTINYCP